MKKLILFTLLLYNSLNCMEDSSINEKNRSSETTDIFYDSDVNKLIELDYFDIIAHQSMAINSSEVNTINIYQIRVLSQDIHNKNFIEKQLEQAATKLYGTREDHYRSNPIFGGTCSYHAMKNALVGLLLLHDYDALVKKNFNGYYDQLATSANLVSEDIKSLTTLRTNLFDAEDFMEKLHSKIAIIQNRSRFSESMPLNIEQGTQSEREYIMRHEFDSILYSLLAQRIRNIRQNHSCLSFVNHSTINNLTMNDQTIEDYSELYEKCNSRNLYTFFDKSQNFDLATQIALFRKNIIYRHAFFIVLSSKSQDGYGTYDHAISVILDKRGSIINAIVFESNNNSNVAFKQILFDFIELFINENKFSFSNKLRNELISYSENHYGFVIDNQDQNKLPKFESLLKLYNALKHKNSNSSDRELTNILLFHLSKINYVYTIARCKAEVGYRKDLKKLKRILIQYNFNPDNLRDEEISLYNIIQKIEESELDKLRKICSLKRSQRDNSNPQSPKKIKTDSPISDLPNNYSYKNFLDDIFDGKIDIVKKALINKCIDVNQHLRKKHFTRSAVKIAIERAGYSLENNKSDSNIRLALIKLLIRYGAKINEKISEDNTALEQALSPCMPQIPIIELLLKNGAEITQKALTWANNKSNSETIKQALMYYQKLEKDI